MTRCWRNKKILVTGGFGFIGRNLVARLLEEGAQVTVVDRSQINAAELNHIANGSLEVVVADIRDPKPAEEYVADQDIIFHLAGHSGPVGSLEAPYTDLEVNCEGTLNILEAVREVNPSLRVVFPSSRLVYGKPKQLPVSESAVTKPLTIYGTHKLTAENYLQVYCRNFGVETVVLRISNPYGPHVPLPHHKYNILNWFIDLAKKGGTLTVFGEGEQLRDYLYIGDLVAAFLAAARLDNLGGEIFNVGGRKARPFVEVAKTVVDVVGKGEVKHVPWPDDYKQVETGDWDFDISKAKNILGWEPQVTLAEGIEETLRYYKEEHTVLGRLLQL